MKIFVIGRNGLGLMPTSPRKARILLKEGKARIVRKAYNQVNLSELKVISHNHNWLTGALAPIGK